jgi:uncharacterized membrane protein YtjA (UPF0391 family)
MLGWAAFFLVLAILAALFGFVGIAGLSFFFAKILFFLFLVIFVASLLMGLARRTSSRI